MGESVDDAQQYVDEDMDDSVQFGSDTSLEGRDDHLESGDGLPLIVSSWTVEQEETNSF